MKDFQTYLGLANDKAALVTTLNAATRMAPAKGVLLGLRSQSIDAETAASIVMHATELPEIANVFEGQISFASDKEWQNRRSSPQ